MSWGALARFGSSFDPGGVSDVEISNRQPDPGDHRTLVEARRVALVVAVAIGLAAVPTASSADSGPQAPQAPHAPGLAATFADGDKDGFGTARSLKSKVRYTLNDGALTEIFYPRIDTPATRDTQLVVSDGATFTEREDTHTESRTELVDERSLVYQQINTATSGKYRITKTYVTDPARSAVLVDIDFE